MAADELTKALLLEEVAAPDTIAEALFASVTGSAPLLHALVDAGAIEPELLGRYLARTEIPFVRTVEPQMELVDRLPKGLCARLLAVPVREDPSTRTVDVAVADPADLHPATEIAFHLRAPVRQVRATVTALDEGLRRIRMRHDGATRASAGSLPPPAPALFATVPSSDDVPPRRGGLVIDTDSVPPPPSAPSAPLPSAFAGAGAPRIRTPPWGTPVHSRPPTQPPPSVHPSDVPIPLTRRAWAPGGTQRPPAFDAPVPPQAPPPEALGVLGALRNASTRDDVLELVLSGATAIARKVAVFVVKKGGYHGWAGSAEFAERAALLRVQIPLDMDSIFDDAVRDQLYLGPVRVDEVHGPLLRAMRSPGREVAIVPIRVSGKTAAMIVADDLEDTMNGTRALEALARGAGESFARLLRARR